jgi:hypothetical protein
MCKRQSTRSIHQLDWMDSATSGLHTAAMHAVHGVQRHSKLCIIKLITGILFPRKKSTALLQLLSSVPLAVRINGWCARPSAVVTLACALQASSSVSLQSQSAWRSDSPLWYLTMGHVIQMCCARGLLACTSTFPQTTHTSQPGHPPGHPPRALLLSRSLTNGATAEMAAAVGRVAMRAAGVTWGSSAGAGVAGTSRTSRANVTTASLGQAPVSRMSMAAADVSEILSAELEGIRDAGTYVSLGCAHPPSTPPLRILHTRPTPRFLGCSERPCSHSMSHALF